MADPQEPETGSARPGRRGAAIVTGASSGIGAAIAHRLHDEGYTVIGLDLAHADAPAIEETIVCDVGDRDAVEEAAAQVERAGYDVSAIVTSAGIWRPQSPTVIDSDIYNALAAVHLAGTAYVIAAFTPPLRRRGSGRIVTITTDLALSGNTFDPYYVTLKGAVLGLMRNLSRTLAPSGILVNTVAPGATDTPILPPDSHWRTQEVLSGLPLPQLVRPEEIAEAVAFACRDDFAFSGQVLSPNAGQAM